MNKWLNNSCRKSESGKEDSSGSSPKGSQSKVVDTNGHTVVTNGDVTDFVTEEVVLSEASSLELTPLVAKGLVDPSTGKHLSLDEAIKSGLLDPSTGEFVDPDTGLRLSLEEALSKNLIDARLAETLSNPCGVFDPKTGRQISLLEAIDKGLFDPLSKSFVDPITGEPVSVDNAVKLGFILQKKVSELQAIMGPIKKDNCVSLIEGVRSGLVDPATGECKVRGKSLTLARAISEGLVDIESSPSCGLALSDAIRQGVFRPLDGKITDRNTGLAFNIEEAIDRGLINKNKYEVYDEEKGYKVTLETALSSGLLDGSEGRLMGANGAVALDEAARNNKIQVPLTVKDSVDLGWVGEDNICKDPITGDNLPILEAVGRGFIDYELKSVRDVKNEVYVSLGDALSKAIVKPDGRFTDTLTGESMSLADAVKKGFLTSVSQKTIFDIEGIKNPATGDYINFNEAMDLRIIDKNNSTFFDKKTLTRMTLAEAVDKDYIQSQLLDMLQKPIGISVMNEELTLLEAVMHKRIDPLSGLLIDPSSQSTLPLEVAVAKNLITPMGAAVLKSLLNITVTTATVTQTVRRTIKVSSNAQESNENAISFQDALKKGLIDEATGIFTVPDTGKEIALDEAINLGMVRIGQTPVRKTSTSSSRKASTSSVASSRKSSAASSRSASPPKSLSSAKEFLSESSKRESRTSLLTSMNMKVTSSSSSTKSTKNSSAINSTTSSRVGSPEKNKSRPGSQPSATDRPASRVSNKSSGRSSPQKSKPGTPVGNTKRLDRLDSFEKRMEDSSSNIFTAESKHDYSFKSESTRSIPIRCEDTPPRSGSYDPPPEGYTLKDAIDEELFDPVAGLFSIPGTDRETSFQECLELHIINGYSATVSHQSSKYSLKSACERSILDSTGHYSSSATTRISMKEAIEQEYISHQEYRDSDIQASTTKLTENIEYNTASGSYEVKAGVQPGELMSALKEGKILPSDIRVNDPSSGQQGGSVFHLRNQTGRN